MKEIVIDLPLKEAVNSIKYSDFTKDKLEEMILTYGFAKVQKACDDIELPGENIYWMELEDPLDISERELYESTRSNLKQWFKELEPKYNSQ